MPTFVAPNMEYNAELDDHYAPYNKPSAIATWLRVCVAARHRHLAVSPTGATLLCGHYRCLHCVMSLWVVAEARRPLAVWVEQKKERWAEWVYHGRACWGVSQEAEPEEEYIMVIDADSILRMPFLPERLGVERGAQPRSSTLS